MADLEKQKKNAALRALSYVKDGMTIGLGTGSTANYFIEALGSAVKSGKLKGIYGVCTSFDSRELALQSGLRVGSPDKVERIDLAVDGADAVDSKLNSIKGGGGALAREKIVAYNSKKFILIADESKFREKLTGVRVPIEVLEFAYPIVLRNLRKEGYKAEPRRGTGKLGPIVTDNGNLLIDLHTDALEPKKLEEKINNIPGVVEVGVFTKCDLLILGTDSGYKEIKRKGQ